MSLTLPEIFDDEAIDELLSRPTAGVIKTLQRIEGDVMVLGAGGKMGPTLALMLRRAMDEIDASRRVIAVARFSDGTIEARLRNAGIEILRCDLLDRNAVQQLPLVANVIFMAGQKFGTSSGPELTWSMNTLVPAFVAEHFARSRIVAFSTGCVYPFTSVLQGGSREEDALGPSGDYANSCVGRERIFSYFAAKNQTPLAIVRLNYAIDLRYGVLLDVAQKVWAGETIDVTMGHVNVIWQGDANAQAIQCLEHAASPPFVLNVTGTETISVRALAHRFGELLGREAKISGLENSTAWLNNAAKAHQLFGYPTVSLEQMLQWTAEWVQRGGKTLNKPTHFETRDGKF
jgi:nucleoside-diphosphate-sugar epimerase